MSDGSKAHIPEPLLFIWVILKVVLFITIWLGIFLTMFLGYFTIPIIIIGLVVVIYAFTDIGAYVAVSRQKRRAEELRAEFQKSNIPGEHTKDF
jgi:hypothetical protein